MKGWRISKLRLKEGSEAFGGDPRDTYLALNYLMMANIWTG
jgi:hypothetical protein